jgi:hypothetical protein
MVAIKSGFNSPILHASHCILDLALPPSLARSLRTQICRATEEAKGMMPITVRMEMAGTTT